MSAQHAFRENAESLFRVAESAHPGELSAYFNLRGKPGAKARDHDPRSFFVLAYEGDRVVGGIRCLSGPVDGAPLHIEQRAQIDIAEKIFKQTGADVRGKIAGEIASVVIAPELRGTSIVRALYAEAATALVKRGADFLVAAPYYPNDQLVLRFLKARGETALSLGQTPVIDDNGEAGRLKNLLVMPVTPDMKAALAPPKPLAVVL